MLTIVVENVPPEVYADLQRRAADRQHSVGDELLSLLQQVLPPSSQSPRLPDVVPSEAIPAPCDLPRSSEPVTAVAYQGAPRLPDPWILNQADLHDVLPTDGR
jgi:hypothetical protein